MLQTSENRADRSPALAPKVEIHTLRDADLDERRERFFEAVEHLIFSDRHDELRKAEVLRRFARRLDRHGDGWSAGQARHLAEVYEHTIRQFR
jgi:hypothetical protein